MKKNMTSVMRYQEILDEETELGREFFTEQITYKGKKMMIVEYVMDILKPLYDQGQIKYSKDIINNPELFSPLEKISRSRKSAGVRAASLIAHLNLLNLREQKIGEKADRLAQELFGHLV